MSAFSFFRIGRTYKNIGRLRHIVNVLVKHGFGQFLDRMGVRRLYPLRRRLRSVPPAGPLAPGVRTLPERLRLVFEELGPTFIKFGQILSTRPDLIPREFVEEFSKLQDEVPPFPVEEVKAIIESELKQPLDQLLLEFEEHPLAAASIAQVHGARLKNGDEVVFKVRRPRVEEIIEQDMDILAKAAELMDTYIPEMRIFNPQAIVDEFAASIRREMDFLLEADNAQRFRRHFADSDAVYIPRVYHELTTSRVLVMERLRGIKVTDMDRIQASGHDLMDLARKGADAYFKMILEDGFFHADPHPGNLFVMPDGRIGMVDFGIVGRITQEQMQVFADTFLAFINRDFDTLALQYLRMGFVPDDVDPERFRREFRTDLADLVEPLMGRKLTQIKVSEYSDRAIRLAVKYRLRFPRDLYLMNKTLITIEGLAYSLAPEIDFYALAKPYAEKLLRRQYSARVLAQRARKEAMDLADMALLLPRQVRGVLRKLERDNLHVHLHHAGLERFIREFDRASNRLAFALIISAIIIGASLLFLSARDVTTGYPLLAIVGFGVAMVLGLWLVFGIMRSGRL